MADDKDVPLRAAEIPPSAVQAASGAGEPAAPAMADGADVQADRGAEYEASKKVVHLDVKIPETWSVDLEEIRRVTQKVIEVLDGEQVQAIGAALWIIPESWRQLAAAIGEMEIENYGLRQPKTTVAFIDPREPGALDALKSFIRAAGVPAHDSLTCEHPECKGKRGQA